MKSGEKKGDSCRLHWNMVLCFTLHTENSLRFTFHRPLDGADFGIGNDPSPPGTSNRWIAVSQSHC